MISRLFKTSDGEFFGNEQAAIEYEKKLEAAKIITEEVIFGGYQGSAGYTCRTQRVKISSDGTIVCGTYRFSYLELESVLKMKNMVVAGLQIGNGDSIKIGCTVGYFKQLEAIRDVYKRLNKTF